MSNIAHLSAFNAQELSLSSPFKAMKEEPSSPALSPPSYARSSSTPTSPHAADFFDPAASRCSRERRKALPRRREEGHVRRPANPFILFACEFRAREGYRGRDNRVVSKEAGVEWRNMSERDKKEWRDKAEMVKVKHAEEHPDYHYKPRRRDTGQSPPPKKVKDTRNAKGDPVVVFPQPQREIEAMYPSMGIARDGAASKYMEHGYHDSFTGDDVAGPLLPPIYHDISNVAYEAHVGELVTPPVTSAPNGAFSHFEQSYSPYFPQYDWNSVIPFISNVPVVPSAQNFAAAQHTGYPSSNALKIDLDDPNLFPYHLSTFQSQFDIPHAYSSTLLNQ